MQHRVESDEIYEALVSELAHTVSPTSVMGLSIIVVGTFAFYSTANVILLCATIIGSAFSAIKVVIMLRQRQRLASRAVTRNDAVAWERLHALATFTIAASIATLGAPMIQAEHDDLKVLATALLFGYAAGVATRVSVRPFIALTAISIAAVPIAVSAAIVFDTAHVILTAMFTVFLAAAFQSVWHVYRMTARQIALRLEMEQHARTDTLTGLSNRLALQEAFARIDRSREGFIGVHYLDLDGFKSVNDRLGHAAGDAVLSALGTRLRDIIDLPSVAARIGGDEFIIFQADIRDPREARVLAERIFESGTKPCMIDGEDVSLGLSLGYAIAPAYSADVETLIQSADAAAYRVKRKGGGIEQEEGIDLSPVHLPECPCVMRKGGAG